MGKRKQVVEPNYKRMLEGHISATQIAYGKYKKALINQLQNTSIGNDGNFVYYDGLQSKVDKARDTFIREMQILNAFKVYYAKQLKEEDK